MNPGIFYLYEYNKTQKLRNAGFMKITRYYHSCTLQLNARGIPVSYADTIKLYVFFMEDEQAKATVLTEITCANHALSARMTSAESQFPEGRSLENIDGFFLRLPNGHILAATAPGITIDAKKLLSTFDGPSPMETVPDDTEVPIENSDDTASADMETQIGSSIRTEALTEENNEAKTNIKIEAESVQTDDTEDTTTDIPDQECSTDAPDQESSIDAPEQEPSTDESDQECPTDVPEQEPSTDEPDQEASTDLPDQECATDVPDQESSTDGPDQKPSTDTPDQEASTGVPDQKPSTDMPDQECAADVPDQEAPQQNIRKIQRSELSVLPRKYWHLANNSFLLHGYHNYHHLILIQKDGHYWLGVPGVYDPREARAARLFGFPQFTDSYNKSLQLSDDECDPQENFGYWCCYLK